MRANEVEGPLFVILSDKRSVVILSDERSEESKDPYISSTLSRRHPQQTVLALFLNRLRSRFRRTLLPLALSVLSGLLVSVPLRATTVLALIDKKHHRVVLAGDSLLHYKLADESVPMCKLVATPGCTFGMAGLLYKQYPAFQLKELADQACNLNGDLLHRADAFLDIAREPVTAVASYLRQNERRFYTELLNNSGGEFVIVIFAGTQKGQSAIFARGFKLAADGGIQPLSVDVTEDQQGIGFFAGANQEIAAYVKANKKWQKMDKVAAARKFVQLEIDAHPAWVGPPVSILTVNHLDQEKWVSKGVCEPPTATEPASPATQPAGPPATPPTAPPTTPPSTQPAEPQSEPLSTPPAQPQPAPPSTPPAEPPSLLSQ